ncbi:uncharacterized protein LOC122013734 [Zingiber officinale]|uniref:uncharacterized protein LOC122013734 n=1 Tax=Zingiber officinale TaxID=94328 RepID=UPI001C4A9C04|nr:uncharacterized protein LOC122013734 [Zingiber officinale]
MEIVASDKRRNWFSGNHVDLGYFQYVDPAEAKYQMDRQILLGQELTVVFAEDNRKKALRDEGKRRKEFILIHSPSPLILVIQNITAMCMTTEEHHVAPSHLAILAPVLTHSNIRTLHAVLGHVRETFSAKEAPLLGNI